MAEVESLAIDGCQDCPRCGTAFPSLDYYSWRAGEGAYHLRCHTCNFKIIGASGDALREEWNTRLPGGLLPTPEHEITLEETPLNRCSQCGTMPVYGKRKEEGRLAEDIIWCRTCGQRLDSYYGFTELLELWNTANPPLTPDIDLDHLPYYVEMRRKAAERAALRPRLTPAFLATLEEALDITDVWDSEDFAPQFLDWLYDLAGIPRPFPDDEKEPCHG
jgi:hypothetical protein